MPDIFYVVKFFKNPKNRKMFLQKPEFCPCRISKIIDFSSLGVPKPILGVDNSVQFFFQNTIDFCYIDDKYDLLLIDNHKCADMFLKKVFKMVIFQDFSLF